MVIMLFLVIIFIIAVAMIIITKSGRNFFYNLYFSNGQVNFLSMMLSIAIAHFLISFFTFGFMFALGESGKNLGFLHIILAFMMSVLHFFSNFLIFLVVRVHKTSIPNLISIILFFIGDALIWSIAITWLIKLKLSKSKS